MKKAFYFETVSNIFLVAVFVCVFLFVAFLFAAEIIWTPGTPCPESQNLLIWAAVSFVFCLLFGVLHCEFEDFADDARRC